MVFVIVVLLLLHPFILLLKRIHPLHHPLHHALEFCYPLLFRLLARLVVLVFQYHCDVSVGLMHYLLNLLWHLLSDCLFHLCVLIY